MQGSRFLETVRGSRVVALGLAACLLLAACERSGQVIVLADEPTAQVWVDGVQTGSLGPDGFELPAGPHTVEVRAEGYQTWSRPIEVASKRPTVLQVELEALAGFLVVRSNVSGDTVWIDDKPVGPSGADPHELPAGSHVIRVERPGYTPFLQQVDVPPAETITVEASLARVAVSRPRVQERTETRTRVVPVPVPGYVPRPYLPGRVPIGRPPHPHFP